VRCVQAIRSAWVRVQVPEEFLREETRAQVLGSREEARRDQIQVVVPDPVQVRDQGSESAAGTASLKGERETAWLSDAVLEKTDAAGYPNSMPRPRYSYARAAETSSGRTWQQSQQQVSYRVWLMLSCSSR
jgi:hypothetical protein